MFNLDAIIRALPENIEPEIIDNEPKQAPESKATKKKTSAKNTAYELSDRYVEIPKSALPDLPVDTYIKYRDSDGNLKPMGGKYKELYTSSSGEQIIRLVRYNKYTKKSFVWTVKIPKISKIYKYVDDPSSAKPKSYIDEPRETEPRKDEPQTEEDKILNQLGNKMLFNDNDMLKQKIDTLEAEVAKLAADQKKMFTVIKRMYTNMYQNSALSAE